MVVVAMIGIALELLRHNDLRPMMLSLWRRTIQGVTVRCQASLLSHVSGASCETLAKFALIQILHCANALQRLPTLH